MTLHKNGNGQGTLEGGDDYQLYLNPGLNKLENHGIKHGQISIGNFTSNNVSYYDDLTLYISKHGWDATLELLQAKANEIMHWANNRGAIPNYKKCINA